MGVYVNPPADGFAEILNYKKYVDKSGILAYTNSVLGTPDKLTCFSRPRRFGKSFAAQFTMLQPGSLAEFVGFTEEVHNLCAEYELDFTETRKWYDGYRFNKIGHVYCPNSIMELISTKVFDSYWTTTETYESLRDYINLNMDGLKDAIIDMLGGKNCQIDTGTFQNDMTSLSGKDDILTLLVHLGYLAYDSAHKNVFIPNEEVRGEFIRKFDYDGEVLLVGINYSTKTGKPLVSANML